MRLRTSFIHNVVVHPLLFIADALDALFGRPTKVSGWIDRLHDKTAVS